MKIEYTEKLTKEYKDKSDICFAKDRKKHGIEKNGKPSWGIVLRNDSGEIIGGVSGDIGFDAVYIDVVWVEEAYRGKSYGKILMNEVWKKFKDKDYDNISLATARFQAPEFYKKCGYELEFIRKKRNSKLDEFFFIKRFDKDTKSNPIDRYLKDGKLINYPAKRKLQIEVLKQMKNWFDKEKTYTEKEVNEIIKNRLEPTSRRDHVTLRRDMIDLDLLIRENNGKRYWID